MKKYDPPTRDLIFNVAIFTYKSEYLEMKYDTYVDGRGVRRISWNGTIFSRRASKISVSDVTDVGAKRQENSAKILVLAHELN